MSHASIEVETRPSGDGWLCGVTISDGRGRSAHEVAVTRDALARYAPGASDPTDLVRRSFEFLLEREPKESILVSFELPVIERYFPDYARAIRSETRR